MFSEYCTLLDSKGGSRRPLNNAERFERLIRAARSWSWRHHARAKAIGGYLDKIVSDPINVYPQPLQLVSSSTQHQPALRINEQNYLTAREGMKQRSTLEERPMTLLLAPSGHSRVELCQSSLKLFVYLNACRTISGWLISMRFCRGINIAVLLGTNCCLSIERLIFTQEWATPCRLFQPYCVSDRFRLQSGYPRGFEFRACISY
jgi:hypothetical protein